MSGALARPAAASAPPEAVLATASSRRLAAAVLAVVAAHAVLLLVRPAPAGDARTSASPVMAIRMVRAAAAANAPVVATVVPATGSAAVPEGAPQRAAAESPPPRHPSGPQVVGRAGAAQDAARTPSAGLPGDARATEGQLTGAPDYALGVRLDPGPRPLEDIEPDYPDMVNLREGVVVLRLLISDTGHVDDVGVVRAEPRGVFEEAAVEAFSKARFSPGLAAGRPVKSQITVEVQFMPVNRGARVSGRTY